MGARFVTFNRRPECGLTARVSGMDLSESLNEMCRDIIRQTVNAENEQPKAIDFYKGPFVVEGIFQEALVDICLGYEIPGEGSPILIGSVLHDGEESDLMDA